MPPPEQERLSRLRRRTAKNLLGYVGLRRSAEFMSPANLFDYVCAELQAEFGNDRQGVMVLSSKHTSQVLQAIDVLWQQDDTTTGLLLPDTVRPRAKTIRSALRIYIPSGECALGVTYAADVPLAECWLVINANIPHSLECFVSRLLYGQASGNVIEELSTKSGKLSADTANEVARVTRGILTKRDEVLPYAG